MMRKRNSWCLTIYLASFFFTLVHSVDLWSAREQPCFQIKKTVPMDPNWVNSVDTWYYPRMARYDIYNVATDLLGGNPGDVEEGAMYYDSCITFKFFDDGSFISRGYNGLSKRYNSTVVKPNNEETKFFPADGKGYSATLYSTFTDNKTFAFLPECVTDGVMAWSVLSSIPVLPEDTWQQIRRHALSLGFKKEYFTELRYTSSCLTSVSPPPPPPGNQGWRSDGYARRIPYQ